MKKIVFFILTMMFMFSSLNFTEEWKVRGVMVVYLLTASILGIWMFRGSNKVKTNQFSIMLMFLFVTSCSVSAYANADVKLILGSMVIFLLYLVSFAFLPTMGVNVNKTVLTSVIVSQTPIILVPFLISGVNSHPYRGIFYNPNTLGITAATIFAVLISWLLGNMEQSIKGRKLRYGKLKNLIIVSSLLFTFYLVVISASRTSFLASVICVLVGVAYLTLFFIKQKMLGSILVRFGALFVLIFLPGGYLISKTSLYESFYNNIIYKFQNRASSGDILTTRDLIWERAVKEAGIFGNGSDYFLQEIGIGAHNSFISILGKYGWISLIFFVLFLVYCFYHASKYSLSQVEDRYKYLPLISTVNFLALSMGEEVLFSLCMLIMFFSFGAMYKSNSVESEEKVTLYQRNALLKHSL